MSLNCLFYLTNSPKPKKNSFTISYDTNKVQILIFLKLEPANIGHSCLKGKKDSNNESLIVEQKVESLKENLGFKHDEKCLYFMQRTITVRVYGAM